MIPSDLSPLSGCLVWGMKSRTTARFDARVISKHPTYLFRGTLCRLSLLFSRAAAARTIGGVMGAVMQLQNEIRSNLDDLRVIKAELRGAVRLPAGVTGSSHPGSESPPPPPPHCYL